MNLKNILYLDIETVGTTQKYQQLPERLQHLWDKKSLQFLKKDDDDPATLFEQKAGIFAEFGKIICISVAYFKDDKLRITSFANENEYQLLKDFADMLNKYFANFQLCAHNGKEFDFPYICRRMLINGLKLPDILNIQGKKPWETTFVDTLELWKFGDYKHYTSLDLLSAIFDIPSPKDDIDGSQVHEVYWTSHDLNRIKTYCEKDVLTIVQLMLRYEGKDILTDDKIVYVNITANS